MHTSARNPKRKNAHRGGVGTLNQRRLQLRARNRTAPLCIGFSEVDKYAIKTYQKHFPNHKNYGDITKIKERTLPDFDIFIGGFPCQSFSIAGKRKGFEDTRGTLFFDIARIVKYKKPKIILLENVKGLLSHDGGRTIKTIFSTLAKLGYDLQWQVLNSKDFGVPQNRERIYIVGHLRGTCRPEVFPIYAGDEEYTVNADEQRCAGGQNRRGNYIVQLNQPIHSNNRVYSPEGVAPTLNTMQGGSRQPFIALNGNGIDKNKKTNPTRVRTTSGDAGQLDKMSDTQRYKICGNGMTRNVMQIILERICARLL